MKKYLVKDLMTRDVQTITPDTSVTKAHRLMADHQIRRLPVVKNGRLVGIVTVGDIREAEPSGATTLTVQEINYLLYNLAVKKIMTRNPTTISPEDPIARAAGLMLEAKVSGLPVVDDSGKLVGIITESDIFFYVVQEWSPQKVETSIVPLAA